VNRRQLQNPLEEIDRLDVSYEANHVDASLRHEVVDQKNVFVRVINPQSAAFCDVLNVPAGESLQAEHIAIVRRDQDGIVLSPED
jgi:hypothetical protein